MAPLSIYVPVSVGEALDRLTILDIKASKGLDVGKAPEQFRAVLGAWVESDMYEKLKTINVEMWDILDEQRRLELAQDWGQRYVDIARRICELNDRRCEVKRDPKLYDLKLPPEPDNEATENEVPQSA